jgi:hypothetical protein
MITKNLKRIQCPLCIELRYGRNSILRHLITIHKQTLEQLTELDNKYVLS